MALSREERRLIVLSAGVLERRRDAHGLVESLLAGTEWSRLTEALRQRRLLPTLGPRILDLAEGRGREDLAEGRAGEELAEGRAGEELAEGRAGEELAVAVTQAIEAGRRQATLLQLVGQRVTDMLADAEIRCASLKGPQLGEALYGDVGRRLSSDIDLLVAPEELGRAVEVVRVLGYDAPTDYVEPSGLPQLHFGLRAARGELPSVEIHWRIHWYERRFARERLLPPAVDRGGAWRPAPVDELAALLLYYARDGFVDLRLATDLGAWWDRYGAELPRGALAELLLAYPELARVIPVALEVAGRVVGLPTAQILARERAFDLRDRIAIRLANPNPHASPPQIYADMGLIDGLLMPPGGLRSFVRRQVFLPREVLDEFDRYAPKRRARSSSLARGAGVLGRYGLTMVRLLHLPETPY